MKFLLIVFTSFLIPLSSLAHSGRTNGEGCHHDRKRGGYHCHNGGSTAAPAPSSIRPAKENSMPLTLPSFVRPSTPVIEVRAVPQQSNVFIEEAQSTFYFRDCDEMRMIEKAPMVQGSDGYRDELDSNGNKIACEGGE